MVWVGRRFGAASIVPILATGALLSTGRVLGLLRELLFAANFGTTPEADAFFAAFTMPDLLWTITIAGALSGSLVPAFAAAERARVPLRGIVQAWSIVITVALLPFCLAGILLPSVILRQLLGGLDEQRLAEAAPLLRLLSICLIPAGVTGVLGTFMVYRGKPLVPASNVTVLNLSSVVFLGVLARPLGVAAAAWGLLFGATAQLVCNLWFAREVVMPTGLVAIFASRVFRASLVPTLIVIVLTAVLGARLAVERAAAASLEIGAIASLNYANRLVLFIVATFGTLGNLVLLPRLARAHASGSDMAPDLESFSRLLLLLAPAVIGLTLFPREITSVVLERGQLGQRGAEAIALVLPGFGFAIPLMVGADLISKPLLARSQAGVALIFAGVGLAVTAAVDLLLMPNLGIVIAPVAANMGALASILLMGLRSFGSGDRRTLSRTIQQVLQGAFALGLGLAVAWSLRQIPILAYIDGAKQYLVACGIVGLATLVCWLTFAGLEALLANACQVRPRSIRRPRNST